MPFVDASCNSTLTYSRRNILRSLKKLFLYYSYVCKGKIKGVTDHEPLNELKCESKCGDQGLQHESGDWRGLQKERPCPEILLSSTVWSKQIEKRNYMSRELTEDIRLTSHASETYKLQSIIGVIFYLKCFQQWALMMCFIIFHYFSRFHLCTHYFGFSGFLRICVNLCEWHL